jgi:hypothetical protein
VSQGSPRQSSNGATKFARGSTLLVTNTTKVVGLVIAVLEWSQKGPAQDSVLALCAVFVLGAEALERVALEAIDRLFGRGG